MKIIVALLVLLSGSVSLLKGGSVYLLNDPSEAHGKLTLAGSSIQVDGSTAPAIDLDDVLEADFGEADFQFDYFSSTSTTNDGLPPKWQAQEIGGGAPGTAAYAKGAFTISGTGHEINSARDHYFYVSLPWTGDGQWTVHLTGLTQAEAGLMLRENLDPSTPMFGFGTRPARPDGGGNALRHNRNKAGEGSAWNAHAVPEPFWLRVSRNLDNFDIARSIDGANWTPVEEIGMKFPLAYQAGLYINSNRDDIVGHAVFDQVLFTPPPAEPEALPAGVLLCDGTFLAGTFDKLDPVSGVFTRRDQLIAETTDHIAAVIFEPVTMQDLAKAGPKMGVLQQNGDFMESSLKLIERSRCQMTQSIPVDKRNDYPNVLACVLQPVAPQPSDYEVRLTDGSCIRASEVNQSNGVVAIIDVSGLTVTADPSEVAEIVAGANRVQTLSDFSWQATPATVGNSVPSVQGWQGANQEHIMAVTSGTSIDFPLNGKFRALAMKIALSSDAAPDAQATFRIVADGTEVARSHPFKAGSQPHYVQISLQNPQKLTLVVDASIPGTKVLLIDPVAIRD